MSATGSGRPSAWCAAPLPLEATEVTGRAATPPEARARAVLPPVQTAEEAVRGVHGEHRDPQHIGVRECDGHHQRADAAPEGMA